MFKLEPTFKGLVQASCHATNKANALCVVGDVPAHHTTSSAGAQWIQLRYFLIYMYIYEKVGKVGFNCNYLCFV